MTHGVSRLHWQARKEREAELASRSAAEVEEREEAAAPPPAAPGPALDIRSKRAAQPTDPAPEAPGPAQPQQPGSAPPHGGQVVEAQAPSPPTAPPSRLQPQSGLHLPAASLLPQTEETPVAGMSILSA